MSLLKAKFSLLEKKKIKRMFALHYSDGLRTQEWPVGTESVPWLAVSKQRGISVLYISTKNWFLPITGMSLEKPQSPDENSAS